jgi:hypothetical protein
MSGTNIVERSVQDLEQRLRITEANLTERIAELEFDLEERGWDRMFGATQAEFSRDALRKIARESLLFYMKSPLIRRAVDLSVSYIFGQGVTIVAVNDTVDYVVQEFLADEKNRSELTTPLSMGARDVDLRINGNLFFAFFTNASGLVRVRSIPFDEVQDVICNPDDAKEPWFYARTRLATETVLGTQGGSTEEVLHPDWQYTPKQKPSDYKGRRIDWAQPVYHVRVNSVGNQRFGLSELYSAHDWARTYNEFLANWATITRSLARFAWKVVTKGGATQRAAVKTKLDSTISSDGYNPAPSTGSMFIETADSASLQPVKTAGATTSPADGRRLLLMVCAATGFPETFFGDASVGTLATAKSLDRPTELGFLVRQRVWSEILENVIGFAVEARARAGNIDGLSGHDELDAWDELTFVYDPGIPTEGEEATDDPINTHVDITFPDLVERDIVARVGAVVQAATLGGMPFAGTLNVEYTTRQLLMALGEKSVEEVMEEFFPADQEVPVDTAPTTEALRCAIKEHLALLKEAGVAEAAA